MKDWFGCVLKALLRRDGLFCRLGEWVERDPLALPRGERREGLRGLLVDGEAGGRDLGLLVSSGSNSGTEEPSELIDVLMLDSGS